MIRDPEGFQRWEAKQAAAGDMDQEARLRWFDAMIEHARALGVWPPADPLEGLAEKLEWIHALHSYPHGDGNSGKPGPRS